MDVYVLTENGRVLGAGTDRADVEGIADRRGDQWGPWTEMNAGDWIRRTATDPARIRVQQEIVCVPLAGMPENGGLARDWVDLVAKVVPYAPPVGQPTVAYPWADGDLVADLRAVRGKDLATLGYGDMTSAIERLRSCFREAGMPTEPVIEVGTGAARAWVERVVDARPGGYGPATTQMSALAGMTFVFDTSIPPDEIRVGPVTYVIGTADGIVRPGQMVRIELPSDG